MFSVRQSSFPVGAPFRPICAQAGGAVVAGSVPGAQGARGCGGFHRRVPVGGAAYGTPR